MKNKIIKNPILLYVCYLLILQLDWSILLYDFSFIDERYLGWIYPMFNCIAWIVFFYILKYYSKEYGESSCMKIARRFSFVYVLYASASFYISISITFFEKFGLYAINNHIFDLYDDLFEEKTFWFIRITIILLKEFMFFIRCIICVSSYLSIIEIIRRFKIKCILKSYFTTFVICLLMIFWQILIFDTYSTYNRNLDFLLTNKTLSVLYLVLHILFAGLMTYLIGKINENNLSQS